mgnify:FL=1
MEKTINLTLTLEGSTENTETVGLLFEQYKASYKEESPQSEEQKERLQELDWNMETLSQQNPSESAAYQEFFDSAIATARASEKAGFILGFKTAMKIMCECAK